MNTTRNDRDELLLEAPGVETREQRHWVADDSEETMHQLRHPFGTERPGARQQPTDPAGEQHPPHGS